MLVSNEEGQRLREVQKLAKSHPAVMYKNG